eukprot:358237-Chlamydomonas_euryale.AAC.5
MPKPPEGSVTVVRRRHSRERVPTPHNRGRDLVRCRAKCSAVAVDVAPPAARAADTDAAIGVAAAATGRRLVGDATAAQLVDLEALTARGGAGGLCQVVGTGCGVG